MECIAPLRSETTSPARLTISTASLAAAFATVPDPRRQASVIYPLPAILSLAVAAMLCAHDSVLAIAQWGSQQNRALLQHLGFPSGCAPCQSTLHRLFRKLDSRVLSAALSAYFDAGGTADPAERGGQGVAIDGKDTQRVPGGRVQYEPEGSAVHVLSAFCQEQGVVLAQEPIEQAEEKMQAELTVAPALLERIDWRGRVLTAGTRLRVSLFCQRELCHQVLDAGGDYLLVVKANQPQLAWAIELLFDPPTGTPPLHDRREARTIDKGHGRSAEVRRLLASTDLTGYLDWPGLAQVFRVERTWREDGHPKQQIRYGITSLPPERGPAGRLLALKRGHWLIENRLHRSKDVTLREDASLIHAGQGPSVFAMLRDTALSLLRRAGCHAITARRRYHSQYPEEAIALLLHPPPAHV